MVGEETIRADDPLASLGSSNIEAPTGIVEKWLESLRESIPGEAVLSATVRSRPGRGYFASFRLTDEGSAISSEARADTLDEAVEKAGFGLLRHLALVDPGEEALGLAS